VADPVPAGALASGLGSGRLIVAVAGLGSNLYGLFLNLSSPPDLGLYWEYLTTLPLAAKDSISAVASYDGLLIYAGTLKGRMFGFNPGSSPVDVSPVVTGGINQIVVNTSGDPPGFACLNDANGVGTILQLAQGNWNVLFPSQPTTGETFFGLAVNWDINPGRPQLFVATDTKVYASFNQGVEWEDFSQGLPANPHCSGLRCSGTSLLLSTFGRSLWATEITVPPTVGGGGAGEGGGEGGGGSTPPKRPPIVPK
jgi:hypothetical protein